MNSKNSKTSDSDRLTLNLFDRYKIKRGVINMLSYQILASTIHDKI